MKLLAIDTAMAACSVAVIDTGHPLPLAARFVPMEKGHAEAVAPMVEAAMAEAQVSFKELDRIAVTIGPGTFTGVRIGLSLARGFGVALDIPVFGIDTLSAIAANTTEEAPLLVVADARKGETYTALYDHQRHVLRPPAVMPLAAASEGLAQGTRIIGTAAEALITASGRDDLVRVHNGDLPVAACFGFLAARLPKPDAPPSPLYLRSPDARPQAGLVHRATPLSITSTTSAAVLAQIHGECFDKPWDAVEMAKLLAMPGATTLTALEGDEPVGFVLARRAADEAEIIVIATRPFAQRKGIARRLVTELSSRLANEATRALFLEVAAANTPARALYESCQFKTVATRPNYYANHGEALVMRKDLLP